MNKVIFYLLFFCALASAIAQGNKPAGTWEMTVCADPSNYPMSSRATPGYDNRIAQLLAKELGATLRYVWVYTGSDIISKNLRKGTCDLVMGISDGTMGVTSTIVYYQSPFVFIYPKAAKQRITSLGDPALKRLTIGTYPFSIPYMALLHYNLKDNIVLDHPGIEEGGANYDAPIFQSLRSGRADIAILYGPAAGTFAKAEPGKWELAPVQPVFVPPSLQMTRTWTIAVRPGDDALRDALNIALVRNWNKIQRIFKRYNVPLDEIPPPIIGVQ